MHQPKQPTVQAQVYQPTLWHDALFSLRHKPDTALSRMRVGLTRALADVQVAKAQQARLVDVDAVNAETIPFARELYARMYADPAKLDEPAPGWPAIAHAALSDLPEWTDLREAVAGDADFAAIGTTRMMEALIDKAEALTEAAEAAEAEAAGTDPVQGMPTAEDRIRAALRSAARDAAHDVAEARQLLNGLAPGLGSAPRDTDAAGNTDRVRLAEMLKNNESLRRVMRMVGRMMRVTQAPRVKAAAYEEIVDVERGGDVARLLPSTLALLDDPDLEWIALRDIAERSALQYRLEGTEPQGRGPICVLADASGSMSGPPMELACALTIAAVQTALRERRPITVMAFDTRILDRIHFDAHGHVSAPDHGAGLTVAAAVMRIAGWRAIGGTSFDCAFTAALDAGVEQDRADLVFITDGYCGASPQIMDRLTAAKARGLRVFGMCVNGGSIGAGMAALCDVTLTSADLDARSAGRMLQGVR
jgi:uncharacterized protein with von Willebrand factor type A (vWA) domain